jgi:hypothetical protein
MGSKLTLASVFSWVALVAILFVFFQLQGFIKADPLAGYLASGAKLALIALVAAALGLAIMPEARLGIATLVARGALGFAVLGILTLGLAALGLLRPLVVWPAVLALGGLSYRQVLRIAAWLRLARVPELDRCETGLLCLGALGSLLLLINSLAPLTSNDALVYHLNLPKTYTAASGLVTLPYNVYANMPHYGEMLYTLAYCLAGETGARLFYLVLTLGAAFGVFALARRFTGRKPALAAACFFLVQPLLLDGRTVANVDTILAYFFVAAALLLVEALTSQARIRSLASVGLLAGFMLGIKYTALAPCLSLLALPLVAYPRRLGIRSGAAAVVVAALVFVPWMIKNQVEVGNPVYPMLESTFDGANWDSTQQAQLIRWQRGMGMGRSPADYLLLPFNVGLKGKPELGYARFDGVMTPVLLMLVPLALLRRDRKTAALGLMAIGMFVFWALTSQQMRFLIPCLAVTAVLAARGLAAFADRAGARSLTVVITVASLLAAFSFLVPDPYGKPLVSGTVCDRLSVVMGLESKQEYLEANIQPLPVFEYINRTLPAGEPILMVWENRGYYLDRPYLADSFFEASTVMRLVAASRDATNLALTLRKMGFNYVLVNDWLGEYFSRHYDRQDVARLGEFVRTALEPVHSANRLTLYAIRAQ